MITLANSELQVSLLDPTAETSRLGSRYVTGGYIWQVDDLQRGPLLGGAQFPDEPETFNGQGAPEVFQFTCYRSETEIPQKRVIIGVGTVENNAGTGVTESHWRARSKSLRNGTSESPPPKPPLRRSSGTAPGISGSPGRSNSRDGRSGPPPTC